MKYSVKWVEDHLGITRSALKYYEEKCLLSKTESRNLVNNYREYDENDIDKIWSIKILQEVGYTVNEIKELISDPDTDFYTSISEKVTELERRRDEILSYIEFAKSIKLTGRIPTTKQVGSIRYEDFIKYAHENWNFYDEPDATPYLSVMEDILQPKGTDGSEIDIEKLEEIASILDNYQETQRTCTINAYYQVIAAMQQFSCKSDVVQAVVQLLYRFLESDKTAKEIGEKFNPRFFAQYTAPFFLDGSDIAIVNQKCYGEEGCQFIAEAIANFGGFGSLEELYDL